MLLGSGARVTPVLPSAWAPERAGRAVDGCRCGSWRRALSQRLGDMEIQEFNNLLVAGVGGRARAGGGGEAGLRREAVGQEAGEPQWSRD